MRNPGKPALLSRVLRSCQSRMPNPETVGAERILTALCQTEEGMIFRCRLDDTWTFAYASEGARRLTGWHPHELQHATRASTTQAPGLLQLIHPDDREASSLRIAEAVCHRECFRVELRLRDRDGGEHWALVRGAVVDDAAGSAIALEGLIEDISPHVAAHRRLLQVETRYRSIFDHSVVGMYQTTEGGHYLAANQALADLYGYATPRALIEGLSDIAKRLYVVPTRREDFKAQIREQGRVSHFESEVYRQDGKRIWISEHAHAVTDDSGGLLYYEGTVEDISERHHYQAELEHQANHDPLTGLPNRNLLQDRLEQALAHSQRYGGCVALAFVDLDNFKVVNDSLGHAAGDRLLVEVTQRLLSSVRRTDTVARYGGDEFILIIRSDSGINDPILAFERIKLAVSRPLRLDGHSLHVGCSIGVAVAPGDGKDLQTLLQHADAAMYQAKAAGKGQYHFFTAQLNAAASERLMIESALRTAIGTPQIEVVYQPKIDAAGHPTGCEALVRWNSPIHGHLGPDRFIPVAEETGLIIPLTKQVLDMACRAAVDWPGGQQGMLKVAVNLSARQFQQDHLVQTIAEVLNSSGLPAASLELELTESCLVGDIDGTAATLEALKALGVSIAIDDFGTGYSSLSYLKRLPVDVLKIDRSFVMECDHGSDAEAIPRAIIALGHNLGLNVVAEGVETEAQQTLLREAGCDQFQGYLIARPLNGNALAAFFAKHQLLERGH